MAEQTHAPPATPERADVDVRIVTRLGVALAAAVIACAIVVFGLLAWLSRDAVQAPGPYTDAHAVARFAAPRLETTPAGDIEAFKHEKTRKLDRYAWIDRRRGIVQIPIERAIELMIERGRKESGDETR